MVFHLQDAYPSNFIFIENVFYNDFRHPDAIDYSTVILQWAEKWKVGKFKTAQMDKVIYKIRKVYNFTPISCFR